MRVEYSKGQQASSELIQLHRRASSEASSGRKAKVMLVFAPDWYPSEPYLSLPTLTAVLRQAGHTVVQKDVNLEMYDWYFSEDCLKKVLRRVPQQLDRLRKLANSRGLEEWEQDLQLALCVDRPALARTIPVQFDAVLVRVAQIERFADAVVAGAVEGDAGGAHATQRVGEVGARRIEDGGMEQAGRASRRRRAAARLSFGHDRRRGRAVDGGRPRAGARGWGGG